MTVAVTVWQWLCGSGSGSASGSVAVTRYRSLYRRTVVFAESIERTLISDNDNDGVDSTYTLNEDKFTLNLSLSVGKNRRRKLENV